MPLYSLILVGLFCGLAAFVLMGRQASPAFMADGLDPPAAVGELDAYLADKEAHFADLRPDARKQIVWADPSAKARTPVAIFYIHGFSASAGEVRPLPDLVAAGLGANLYFTRLAGHGRGNDAMAEASVEAWVADFAESLAIGEQLGEKIVVISTSTGGSLTTWALAQPEIRKKIAASVFLSPNYGVQSFGAALLALPFGAQIARLAIGPRRSFEPLNAMHAALWTTEYPVEALVPMARVVRHAVSAEVEAIATPALFIFSPLDQIVDAGMTRKIADRWGGPSERLDPEPVGDPSHHVVAGDVLSPATTQPLAERIGAWLRSLDGFR